MNSIEFVNIDGDPWNPSKESTEKKTNPRSTGVDGYHKGWRVIGHAPGALEKAREEREEEIQVATIKRNQGDASVKIPTAFNESDWHRNGKKSSVRSKPYEIRESAVLCAELAVKAGWEDVEVVEIKKESRE